MENGRSIQLTLIEALLIFAGIVVGSCLAYFWWPNPVMTLVGAMCGGSMAYFAYNWRETLHAGKSALDGVPVVIGMWLLWTGAFLTASFSAVWGLSVFGRAMGHKPWIAPDVLAAAHGAAFGFITDPAWSYVLIALSAFLGIAITGLYVGNDKRSIASSGRPRVALAWYAFANPITASLIAAAAILLFTGLGFFFWGIGWCGWMVGKLYLSLSSETKQIMLWIVEVVGAGIVLLILYRIAVIVHSYRRSILFVYGTFWSLVGGVGAHLYPSILALFPQITFAPPELLPFIATGIAGTLMAVFMLWLLQKPIAKEISRRAFRVAEQARHEAERLAAFNAAREAAREEAATT